MKSIPSAVIRILKTGIALQPFTRLAGLAEVLDSRRIACNFTSPFFNGKLKRDDGYSMKKFYFQY